MQSTLEEQICLLQNYCDRSKYFFSPKQFVLASKLQLKSTGFLNLFTKTYTFDHIEKTIFIGLSLKKKKLRQNNLISGPYVDFCIFFSIIKTIL